MVTNEALNVYLPSMLHGERTIRFFVSRPLVDTCIYIVFCKLCIHHKNACKKIS